MGMSERVLAPGPRAARVVIKVEDSSSGEDTDGGEEDTGWAEGEEEDEVEDVGNVGGRTASRRGAWLRDGTSQFKGVIWVTSRRKWKATCKKKHLGYHATEEAAARAYDSYVKDGVVSATRREGTSSQFKGVSWVNSLGKRRASCKGKHLGHHATEEAAAKALDNYVRDGIVPVWHRDGTSTSQFKGVCWNKNKGKWTASYKGKHLGIHATEEGAAQAYEQHVQNGVAPTTLREGTSSSRFKGVYWMKGQGKWKATCKKKYLGCHATQEAAARAYNTEAERIGLVDVNVTPPVGDTDDGNDTAALALLGLAATSAQKHAGAGSKRAGALTTPAPPQRKKTRLDTAAGAAAGAGAAAAALEARIKVIV